MHFCGSAFSFQIQGWAEPGGWSTCLRGRGRGTNASSPALGCGNEEDRVRFGGADHTGSWACGRACGETGVLLEQALQAQG